MNSAEIEFTRDWWSRCLVNPTKLSRWLQKLQLTEIGGYWDYQRAFKTFESTLDARTKLIFTNIALDEEKHSDLLLDLFEDRKIAPASSDAPEFISSYWTEMNSKIVDLDTFCAVNYYGEGLAAFRFEILHDHPDTPSDIKAFIAAALPDETFHRETLKRLSSDEALAKISKVHEEATAALKKGV